MASTVVIQSSAKQTATIIFLHGLGDTGHGWASAIQAIRQPYVKVICPTASTKPVTLNGGFPMPSWFDLRSLNESGPEDEKGIKAAAEEVREHIRKEVESGISPSRILLGGFSQGGALALYTALTHPERLGGVMALSCWLPLRKSFPGVAQAENVNTPIIQCHGDSDPLVPYQWGQLTTKLLKEFNKSVEFRTYRGMMHSSSDEEMEDLKAFVAKHLPAV